MQKSLPRPLSLACISSGAFPDKGNADLTTATSCASAALNAAALTSVAAHLLLVKVDAILMCQYCEMTDGFGLESLKNRKQLHGVLTSYQSKLNDLIETKGKDIKELNKSDDIRGVYLGLEKSDPLLTGWSRPAHALMQPTHWKIVLCFRQFRLIA